MKNKRFELLQMNLISPDTLFEVCIYMYLKHARVSKTMQAKHQSQTMKSTIPQDLIVLKKICAPFLCGPDIETLS